MNRGDAKVIATASVSGIRRNAVKIEIIAMNWTRARERCSPKRWVRRDENPPDLATRARAGSSAKQQRKNTISVIG